MDKICELNFKMIDMSLKNIAIAKYMLVNKKGVTECEVNDYISETGNKYMTEIMEISKHEVLMLMVDDIMESDMVK